MVGRGHGEMPTRMSTGHHLPLRVASPLARPQRHADSARCLSPSSLHWVCIVFAQECLGDLGDFGNLVSASSVDGVYSAPFSGFSSVPRCRHRVFLPAASSASAEAARVACESKSECGPQLQCLDAPMSRRKVGDPTPPPPPPVAIPVAAAELHDNSTSATSTRLGWIVFRVAQNVSLPTVSHLSPHPPTPHPHHGGGATPTGLSRRGGNCRAATVSAPAVLARMGHVDRGR